VHASAALPFSSDTTNYLVATQFGFSIPAGAVIDGIVVEIERSNTSGETTLDNRVRVVKGGAIGVADKAAAAAWPAADSYKLYGANNDLWGTPWAVADINSTGFGVAVSALNAGYIGVEANPRVDHFRVTVYYTPSAAVAGTSRVTGGGSVTNAGVGPDFDYDVWLSVPTPTSFARRIRGFTVTRGRTGNLERMEAGVAQVEILNGYDDTGANGAPLDPGNVSSPYYGQVLPLRELAVARRRNGVRYNRFKGYVERFEPDWIPPRHQNMTVEASDLFESFANIALESGTASLTTALAGANNDLVFTANTPGSRGDDITVTYVVAGASQPLDADTNDPLGVDAVVTAYVRDNSDFREGGITEYLRGAGYFTKPTGPPEPLTLEAQGNDVTVKVATDALSNPTSTAAQIKAALEANPDVMAIVSVAHAPGSTGAGVVTALAKTNLTGGKWPQELTGTRINRVLDFFDWPTALRRVDSGLFEIVAQGFAKTERSSALSHMQDVAGSELGYCFISGDGYFVYHDGGHRTRDTRSTTSQATFADDGTGFVYQTISPEYSKERIYNRVTVTSGFQGAEPQIAEDTASQTLFSPVPGVPIPRDLSLQTLLARDLDALQIARAVLSSYKDARVRFENIKVMDDQVITSGASSSSTGAGYGDYGYGDGASAGYGDSTGGGGGGGGTISSTSWSTAVLGRELGDRVTVRTTPPAQNTTATYDCFIERIVDERSAGQPWTVTFSLSYAAADGGIVIVPPTGNAGALRDSSGDDFILDSATAGILG